ncbi:MAG: flagellar M-ring protein FliF [Candidatus Saganbacteria bacterium]|nr:flagellar M-ring protein FliF [Candidatus Saganbacteria bacterium]
MAEAAPAGFDIRRILLLAGVGFVIVIALLFFLFRGCSPFSRSQTGYTVIYSNLELKDAANVIARLKELGIPYEIKDEGRAVAVPKQVADDARLGLAEKNLPAGGVVGWEIFDETKLGATAFDRRIQLIRAISGELSRTIGSIQAVQSARVQIVMPETPLFAENVAPVTASVFLRLMPGTYIAPAKINGIVHLVASSVENLRPQNVTIVDSTGRILTAEPMLVTAEIISSDEVISLSELSTAVFGAEEIKVEVSFEAAALSGEAAVARPLSAEEKILLVVKAKKELENNLSGKSQEILNRFYPPNSAVIKVNVELETKATGQGVDKEELSIQALSAVILVDNRVDLTPQLKQSTYKAVAAAIGYDRSRGDQIVLQKVPFHLATPPPEVIQIEVEKVLPLAAEPEKLPLIVSPLIRNIIIASIVLVLILIIILVFKSVRKKSRVDKLPRMEEEDNEMDKPAVNRAKLSTLSNIKNAAERNPERVADMLRKWLSE